jgi:hypothetical protein
MVTNYRLHLWQDYFNILSSKLQPAQLNSLLIPEKVAKRQN